MICDDVLYLVAENPQAHGIFDKPGETSRMVYCRVQSVTRTEFWRAKENGIEPSFVFILSDYLEYQGEKICVYHGERYRVYRTYINGQEIELTVEKVTVDG